MQKKQLINKVITGTTAVVLALTLAACGNHESASSTTSSSTSSSVRSSTTNSDSAYRTANKLIRNEDYQGAYDHLNNTTNRSAQADNLATDLQNYMSARKAYRNGDYATASNNLTEQKSTSPAMRDAYSKLQGKIDAARKSSASSNRDNTSTVNSSSAATKSSSSSTANDEASDDVIVGFANKMGFSGEKGYQIIPTGKSGKTYKFEVRRNNSDNTVSNMVGIYQYNSETGAVTKLS